MHTCPTDCLLAGFLGSARKPKRGRNEIPPGYQRVPLGPRCPEKLNRRARQLFTTEKEGLFLFAASSWEISVKCGLGKLDLSEAPAKCIPKWMSNWRIQGVWILHTGEI